MHGPEKTSNNLFKMHNTLKKNQKVNKWIDNFQFARVKLSEFNDDFSWSI